MNASYSNSLRAFQSRRSSSAGSNGPSRLKRTSCCGVATVAIGSICKWPRRRTVSSTDLADPSSSCARTAILRASSRETTRLAMALDEREDAGPSVLGSFREVFLAAVEEAVGRAGVGDDLVLDAGLSERPVEGVVVLGGDVPVVSGLT